MRHRTLSTLITKDLKETEAYIYNDNLKPSPLIKVKRSEIPLWMSVSPKRFNRFLKKKGLLHLQEQ